MDSSALAHGRLVIINSVDDRVSGRKGRSAHGLSSLGRDLDKGRFGMVSCLTEPGSPSLRHILDNIAGGSRARANFDFALALAPELASLRVCLAIY